MPNDYLEKCLECDPGGLIYIDKIDNWSVTIMDWLISVKFIKTEFCSIRTLKILSNTSPTRGGRHSSVVSSSPTILRPLKSICKMALAFIFSFEVNVGHSKYCSWLDANYGPLIWRQPVSQLCHDHSPLQRVYVQDVLLTPTTWWYFYWHDVSMMHSLCIHIAGVQSRAYTIQKYQN